MPNAWKSWENQLVNSRFVLRQYLGGSEHSAVFLTERPGPPAENAAIKLISCDPGTKDFHFSRWHAIARLSHPHLLRLFHYGQCRMDRHDLLYVVMELADESLSQILPLRALSALETRETLVPAVDALSFLHTADLVHSRIHPANILAVREQIKLSADSLCSVKDCVTLRPVPGPYSAPEIAAKGFSPAADVYALGVSLVETLTQRAPADSSDAPWQGLPIPFDEIAEKALHPDPQLRWTAGDIARRLNPDARRDAAPAAVRSVEISPQGFASPTAKQNLPSVEVATAKVASPSPVSVPLSPVKPLPKSVEAPPGAIAGSGYLKALLALPVLAALGLLTYRTLRHETGPRVAATVAEQHFPPSAKTTPPSPAQVSSAPGAPKPEKPLSDSGGESPSSDLKVSQSASRATNALPSPSGSTPAQGSSSKPLSLPNGNPPEAVGIETTAAATPQPASATSRKQPEPEDAPSAAPAVASGDLEILQQVLPEIGPKALNTIRGSVRVAVSVAVDATGNISSADLSAPSDSSFFNEAALKAARRWQFQPEPTAGRRHYLIRFQFTSRGSEAVPSRIP